VWEWLKAVFVTGGWFSLDVRKHFFTKGMVKPCNWLSEEVVDALCLSVFEAFGQCQQYYALTFWSALKWPGSWTRSL